MDLVRHGINGWIVDVDDVDGLAHWAQHVINSRTYLPSVLNEGRQTARQHAYSAQQPLWRRFFDGFVDMRGPN